VKQNDRYLEEIKRKERESALSHSKADYARRPTSYKASLSNPIVNHGGKKGAWYFWLVLKLIGRHRPRRKLFVWSQTLARMFLKG
jgi:hypothetical protein